VTWNCLDGMTQRVGWIEEKPTCALSLSIPASNVPFSCLLAAHHFRECPRVCPRSALFDVEHQVLFKGLKLGRTSPCEARRDSSANL
jgi:hypothetical protein